MVARRSLAVLASLALLPGIVAAQSCIGTDDAAAKTRAMTVGARLDFVPNANSYGGTFGIANGMAGKPMYMRAHLRMISFTGGSSATGFGFTFGKALVATKTTNWCLFGSMEQVSFTGGSSSNYELGGAYGSSQDVGADLKFLMFIRGGMLMGIGGGTTSSDPFAEVGFGPRMKNGLTVSASYYGVFDGVSDGAYRVYVSYPFNILKQ